jgi:hypothetical protein
VKWLRRQPEPSPEPMTDEEFERLINVYVIRGWTVVSRTADTVTLDFQQVDRGAILAHGSKALRHGTPMKHTRKVLTRWQREQVWLTPQEKRMLGES